MSTDKAPVVFYVFPSAPKTPSPSGYCQKLETFLRFTSTPYETRITRPSLAPKGKLPYVEILVPSQSNPEIVADSHFIICKLISQGISTDPDVTAGLTPAQKADSRAWQAYFDDTIYVCVVYERWFVDKNFDTLVAEGFGAVPWPIRSALTWYMRRSVKGSLWGHGIGRHSEEEVMTLQREAVEALEARLEGLAYFHSDKTPSRIDLTVFGFLANSLGTEANPHWKSLVLKSPRITGFVKRFTESLFPEYEALLGELEDATK